MKTGAVGPGTAERPDAPGAARDTAKTAAKQLEAFFLRQLLAEARPKGGGMLDGGFAGDTFKQMLDEAIADKMSAAGGVGMASLFAKQLGGTSEVAGGAAATAGGPPLPQSAAGAPSALARMHGQAPAGAPSALTTTHSQAAAGAPSALAMMHSQPPGSPAAGMHSQPVGSPAAGMHPQPAANAPSALATMHSQPAAPATPAIARYQPAESTTNATTVTKITRVPDIGGLNTAPSMDAPKFVVPVTGRASSGYGLRTDPIHGGTVNHPGFDLAAPSGTEVAAAARGTVVHAGPAGTYGNLVILRHDDGFETRYAHLSQVDVKVGDAVESGAEIGKVGSTGHSTGPHLHFEIRHDGKAIDPAPLLPLNSSASRTTR